MKMRKWISILAIASLTSCLSACHSSATPTKNDKQEAVTTKGDQTSIDNYGEKVTLTAIPQHVITMGPNDTELFCALGLNDKVIGCCLNNHSRGPLPKYKKQFESIKELTHAAPTKEAVLGSNTDFIYGIDWAFGDEGVQKKELTEAHIPVMVNKAQNLKEEYNEIQQLGQVFHVEKQAQQLISNQKNRIATVQQKVSKQKPLRVLVYDSGENGIFTATGHNFENELIQKAGGQNIFSDLKNKEWTTVSSEEASKRNPQVIIVHDYDQPALKTKIANIKKDPALKSCEAVKKNRFVAIPLEAVLPGPRMAYTVEIFASAFHPKQVNIIPEEGKPENQAEV